MMLANPDSFLGQSQTSLNFINDGGQVKGQMDEYGNVKLYDPTKGAPSDTQSRSQNKNTIDEVG